MNNSPYFKEALGLTLQRFIRLYLAPGETTKWTIEGACVTARLAGNRSGVPADASSFRYLIEHPEQGWAVAVRAVWRSGELMRPLATHVVVESVWDDSDGRLPSASLLCDWLVSLPL